MTPQNPPRLATALLTLIARPNAALVGDLHEQFQRGRSRGWYWRQVAGAGMNRCLHDPRCLAIVVVFVLAAAAATVGWEAGRLAVPIALGIAISSWGLWRFHRTSLAILYATSVAVLLPHWMIAHRMMPTVGDRVFWSIAELLAGYGVVGVLLVPFLILRLGRSGPLAEKPISLSLSN
jgi:hypothetical protein